jgi:hypothetical protein
MRAARLVLQIANLRHAVGVIGRISTPTAENPRGITAGVSIPMGHKIRRTIRPFLAVACDRRQRQHVRGIPFTALWPRQGRC